LAAVFFTGAFFAAAGGAAAAFFAGADVFFAGADALLAGAGAFLAGTGAFFAGADAFLAGAFAVAFFAPALPPVLLLALLLAVAMLSDRPPCRGRGPWRFQRGGPGQDRSWSAAHDDAPMSDMISRHLISFEGDPQ
jgi:hypothetical protein